ncbi:MAG: FAD-dependent oxidoreductase [Calditrichaceae bacterium]|nr:FAD-dependent oxidoreductase [Calditrichaceae bacterium]MBN2708218.1 FAD-dependent oxidoreductase [Calditrichaceae bacterium]RQV92242.1 MAG: pyridine nucleotide-disulfide oxidoreductase [Calditrichota bacterium]
METDILVIGGGPAGMVSAITARRYYPDKKIKLIRNVLNGCVPCGIPYMFYSLKDPTENKMGIAPLENNKIDVFVDEAISINRTQKTVTTVTGKSYGYKKLILALGSKPMVPPIPGIDKAGVYPVYKDMDFLLPSVQEVKKSKKVIVIGGGFIGVEFADEISKINGKEVVLIETLDRILANSFDKEFSQMAHEKLTARGVKVIVKQSVKEIIGKDRVEKVRLSSGEEIEADSIILGTGAVPTTKIAVDAGLAIGMGKGIWVDEYMRTTDPDIFAVGDCAGKRDFYTRKDTAVMLASTATAEARVAGANLYKLQVIRENKGTIAIYSTYVDGLIMGSAGLTEVTAKKENFDIVTGSSQTIDKHPGTLPGAHTINVKLIFSRKAGILLGGQVTGGPCCGELINIIGMAIQQRVSYTELETLQMATHPFVTAAPTMYPIVMAALDASKKI